MPQKNLQIQQTKSIRSRPKSHQSFGVTKNLHNNQNQQRIFPRKSMKLSKTVTYLQKSTKFSIFARTKQIVENSLRFVTNSPASVSKRRIRIGACAFYSDFSISDQFWINFFLFLFQFFFFFSPSLFLSLSLSLSVRSNSEESGLLFPMTFLSVSLTSCIHIHISPSLFGFVFSTEDKATYTYTPLYFWTEIN